MLSASLLSDRSELQGSCIVNSEPLDACDALTVVTALHRSHFLCASVSSDLSDLVDLSCLPSANRSLNSQSLDEMLMPSDADYSSRFRAGDDDNKDENTMSISEVLQSLYE